MHTVPTLTLTQKHAHNTQSPLPYTHTHTLAATAHPNARTHAQTRTHPLHLTPPTHHYQLLSSQRNQLQISFPWIKGPREKFSLSNLVFLYPRAELKKSVSFRGCIRSYANLTFPSSITNDESNPSVSHSFSHCSSFNSRNQACTR